MCCFKDCGVLWIIGQSGNICQQWREGASRNLQTASSDHQTEKHQPRPQHKSALNFKSCEKYQALPGGTSNTLKWNPLTCLIQELCVRLRKSLKVFHIGVLNLKNKIKSVMYENLLRLWLNYKQIVYTVIRQNSKAFQAFEVNHEAFEVYIPFSKYALDSDFE